MKHYMKIAVQWFENNLMKLNEDKCHFLVAGQRYETLWVNFRQIRIWESKDEKLLGLIIDRNLNDDDHVFTLSKTLAENCQVCLEFQIT